MSSWDGHSGWHNTRMVKDAKYLRQLKPKNNICQYSEVTRCSAEDEDALYSL